MKEDLILELQSRLQLNDQDVYMLIDALFIVEDPPQSKEVVKINPITLKAQTVKIKNLTVNWKKLTIDSAELGISIAGAVTTPWLIPFAALLGISKLMSGIKIELTPYHAIILQAMWENSDLQNPFLNIRQAFELTSRKIIAFDQPLITESHFLFLLKELAAMKTIDIQDEQICWLKETVTFDTSF
jgi:hypothetical protein